MHPFPNITCAKILDTSRRHNLMGVGGELSLHGFIVSGWGEYPSSATGNQIAIQLQQQGQVMMTSCDFEWGGIEWSPPSYLPYVRSHHSRGDIETKASLMLISSRMLSELVTPGQNSSSVVRLGASQTGHVGGGLWPDQKAAPSPFLQLGGATLISRQNTCGQTELCAQFTTGEPVCFARSDFQPNTG